MQVVVNKVINRTRGWGRGSVFTPSMFLDLGSRDAIDKILSRFAQKGVIRRLSWGLYDFPKKHPEIGTLSPSPDAIAKAIAKRDAVKLLPTGAYAANLLGLSTQVPAQITFLTDGASRTVSVGKVKIFLRHTTPKNMAVAGKISGLVIQALKYLGKDSVDTSTIHTLKNKLNNNDKDQLVRDLIYAPSWIGKVIRKIVEDH